LLERLLRHGVRLVDQHHHPPPGGIEADERFLQLAQRNGHAPVGKLQIEVVGDRVQNLVAREQGRRQVDRLDMRRQALHQHPAEHGLAASDLAGNLDDAFVVQDCVHQRFQGRAAIGPVEEEVRMRRDAEGRLRQAEMLEIQRHAYFFSRGRDAGAPPFGSPVPILL
jgi:hypothetical protein